MKLGTEEKWKVWALGGLLVVAGYFVYGNLSDSTPTPAPKAVASERNGAADLPATDSSPASRTTPPTTPRQAATRSKNGEFRPTLHSKRPEDRVDPLTVDPTLRLDLMAKLHEMKPESGSRNLFQFGAPPKTELKGPEPIVAVARPRVDYPRPLPPPPPPVEPPPPPPEPPIDVKYYGVAKKKIDGKKTAFFLDADNTIIFAIEGGIVKKKYRVVSIGDTSVQMENIDNKKRQSVPLAEDAGANMSN
jgi:hypothetical protein